MRRAGKVVKAVRGRPGRTCLEPSILAAYVQNSRSLVGEFVFETSFAQLLVRADSSVLARLVGQISSVEMRIFSVYTNRENHYTVRGCFSHLF